MSKEWLEDIKERFVKYQSDYNLNGEDVEWLIQQAECVQELKKENRRYHKTLKNIYELAEYDEYDNTLEQIVSEVEKALEGTE